MAGINTTDMVPESALGELGGLGSINALSDEPAIEECKEKHTRGVKMIEGVLV